MDTENNSVRGHDTATVLILNTCHQTNFSHIMEILRFKNYFSVLLTKHKFTIASLVLKAFYHNKVFYIQYFQKSIIVNLIKKCLMVNSKQQYNIRSEEL